LPLPIGAAVSLAQIDPEAARQRIDWLWLALGLRVPTNTVIQLRPLKNELVPKVERELETGGGLEPRQSVFLLYNLLFLDPANRLARERLERNMRETKDPVGKAVAAKWLFEATGEREKIIPVFREALKTVTDVQSQSPVTIVADLGPAGRELAPQIRPLLEHQDAILRMLAGKALRSIAPDQMPPINETADW
jgi:hypothetical protein